MIINHPNHPKGGYFIEKDLYDNISQLPKRIIRDKDVVAVFVGSPGEGKSTLAQQVLYALDPTISVNSIKYSYEDYVKYCLNLFHSDQSRGKGVIHDEGKEALSAVSIMSKRTRSFMNFLYENRQMNMYQFILSGDFFDIPKSIIMQRCMFMVWVHEGQDFDNGFFKFYNRSALKKLYIRGKKERNMQASKYSLRGQFKKFYTIDEDKYRRIKKSHLEKDRYIEKQENKKITLKDAHRLALQRNPEFNKSEFSRVFDCNLSLLYKHREDAEFRKMNNLITMV